jgi:hypothetical protein
METSVIFLDCPAYLDNQSGTRCGLPAEVEYRYTVESPSGPLGSAKIRCPRGHWFNGLVESLTWGQHSGAEQERAHEVGPDAESHAGRLRIGRAPRW